MTKSALVMATIVGAVLVGAYIFFPEDQKLQTSEEISKRLKRQASLAGEAVDYLGLDVEFRKNGSAIVTAAVRVHATHNHIVYGISLGIPLAHIGPDGSLVTHRFGVVKGFRNGDPVATTSFTSGDSLERVYLGNVKEAVKLEPGEHSFQLLYKLDNVIDHTTERDSISDLDLIGAYWKVPIKSVTIALRFPSDFPLAQVEHSASIRRYNGATTPAMSRLDNNNQSIQFWAPIELNPLHGLVINAHWPGGYISRIGKNVYVKPEAVEGNPAEIK